jgi:hypothetical protein
MSAVMPKFSQPSPVSVPSPYVTSKANEQPTHSSA